MQYVVAEGSHKRMYRVCDVCHGMYQNAVQKHSGFMALVMAYKTNQEMSTYVLNTVMSICGPDAALRLAKYPGSKGLERQIEEFVLKYKDTGWPRIKRDYRGALPGVVQLKDCLQKSRKWRKKLQYYLGQVDYKPPDGGFLPWSSDAIQLEVPRLAFRGLGPPDGAE
jgi:hypothetical protein